MKSFLSKNWKKILIIIGIILLVLNIIGKTVAPHTVVQDYAKYGKDVEASNINVSADIIVNDYNNTRSQIPDNIFRVLVILAVGLLSIAIISDLVNKKPAGKKK